MLRVENKAGDVIDCDLSECVKNAVKAKRADKVIDDQDPLPLLTLVAGDLLVRLTLCGRSRLTKANPSLVVLTLICAAEAKDPSTLPYLRLNNGRKVKGQCQIG
jgi:hypothetical protein